MKLPVTRVLACLALWLGASSAAQPQVRAPRTELPTVGNATISGRVTDADTGRPVAGALVQLENVVQTASATPQSRPRRMADGQGRFVFDQLPSGSYGVRVEAPGYLAGGYGRVPDSGAAGHIALQDREWFGDANVMLWKPASISGTIRDERGEPLVDVPVRILRAFTLAGRDQWAAAALIQTDDRGVYRVAGLLPGRYVVQVPSIQVTLPDGEIALYQTRTKPNSLPAVRATDGIGAVVGYFAVPPPGRGQVYPATFYPAARSLSIATVIEADFGTQQSAVDVSLVPVSSVRVSGVVLGPSAAIGGLPVRLLVGGHEFLGFGGEVALTVTDTIGRFTLSNVPEGEYTLMVGRAINEFVVRQPRGQPRVAPNVGGMFLGNISAASVFGEPGLLLSTTAKGGPNATGRISLTVGTQAVEGLIVRTIGGVTISGRALYDGVDAPADGRPASRFGPMIRLDPADGDITRTAHFSTPKLDSTGPTFSIENVMPGRYRVLDQGNGDYRLIGATWNGQDLFTTPLEVTGEGPVTGVVVHLSSKHNSVAGVVRSADGQKRTACALLIFPQDRNRWREPGISALQFRIVDVADDGVFLASDLIPGDYFIAAVAAEHRRRGLNIEFLEALVQQATRIRVSESATLTLDLRITRVGR